MTKRLIIIGFSTLATVLCHAQFKQDTSTNYKIAPIHIHSRWALQVSPKNSLKEYPRPQLQRMNWKNLNGLWEYAITDTASNKTPETFEGKILVPYPIESALSGVQKKLKPENYLWYKKTIRYTDTNSNKHTILNFGAVDWQTTLFINSKEVGQHSGGYQSFSYDITPFLKPGNNIILIKVYDPSDQGPNPHGKQVLNPSNIYYTPSSGIWQTVWLETVSEAHITGLKSTPDIDKSILDLNINTTGKVDGAFFEIVALANGQVVNRKKVSASDHQRNITIDVPNPRLWSPDDPFLYDLSIKLTKGNEILDEVKSYFGMRKVNIQKDEKGADRIFLNNKYTYNLGILDQGFWPEGLYTAPTDEALAFDIKAIKSLGFNTIRKHIKIEPERWYYHADKLGILVWQDFVNPPHGLPEGSRAIFEKETMETMEQLHNHPSIITWVLFNERWGAYDQERLTNWVKKHDPSRIVNGHSGELLYVDNILREPSDSPWIASDMTDVHSYPNPRNAPAQPNKARVIGEFGGVGVPVAGHEWDDMQGWGYVQVTPNELKDKYNNMMKEIKQLESLGLSASIYTQPFDVEGEENGLITYDREIIKMPVNEIRAINDEMVNLTKGFDIDPNFMIAQNINTNDNDNRYNELLEEYKKGSRDSILLRRLTLISIRKKDQKRTTEIGNNYINILTSPFSKENLTFIRAITKSSNDKGFELFRLHPEKIDAVLGENTSALKVKGIINAEEIEPFKKSIPNWDSIQQKVTAKYGNTGEELVLGKRMIYYGFESPNKNWEKFAKYYILYFDKALSHPEYDINGLSWALYLNTNDSKILNYAANVMKYAIDKWDKSPEAYDTYANLLHKLNKTSEAIPWEEKAVKLKKGAPDEKLYTDALQKMKSGLPTWPQNN